MGLADDVQAEITAAMKGHDSVRLSAFRMLKTALTNRSVEKGRPLDETEALQVVAAGIKQRRDSIEQFVKGGRHDLAAREEAELNVLIALLPPPVDAVELERIVGACVADTGAASQRDLGRVMKEAMGKLAGRAVDGRQVNDIARRLLGG